MAVKTTRPPRYCVTIDVHEELYSLDKTLRINNKDHSPKVCANIPTLIHVSWDLDGIKSTLARFEASYGLDLDPEFQRGHRWEMPTKIKFIEYILRGGVVQPIRFNGPTYGGQPHAKHSDLPEDVVLVDGKQRLTAIIEFMDNKVAVFGGVYPRDFDNPDLLLLRTCISDR